MWDWVGVHAIALYLCRSVSYLSFLEGLPEREAARDGEPWGCKIEDHVRIFLFPDTLDSAVECAEHAAPHAEVASQYGRAHLDGCDGT